MVRQQFNQISGDIARPIADLLEGVSDINLVRQVLRRLFRLGMVPVRNEARATSPVFFGDMQRAIKIRAARRRADRVTMRTTIELRDLDIAEDRIFYPIAVHNGFKTRAGNRTQGDPWMAEAAMRRRSEVGRIIETRFVGEFTAIVTRRQARA